MSIVERRAHQRQDVDFLTVARGLGLKGKTYPPQAGFLRDVSTGGIFFFAPDRMEPGDRIFLAIYPKTDCVEDSTPPKLVAKGKVVRVENAPDDPVHKTIYGIAVKFDKEPEVVFERHGVASIIRLMSYLPPKVFIRHTRKKSSA